jgi:methylenetetrahydrofolate dehydrogenase (NADP+)/methenyltetrahydrofolate cyclohydrolase
MLWPMTVGPTCDILVPETQAINQRSEQVDAKILDGRSVAGDIQAEIKRDVETFEQEFDSTPTLALVRAGDEPASVSYGRMIKRTARKCGIAFQAHTRPADVSEIEMLELVRELSADPMIHAIIVQRPMPEGIRAAVVTEALSPAKDVDGAHPLNAGRLAQAVFVDRPQDVGPYLVPATPLGGLELLKRYNVEIDGKRAVIVAASNLIGKPLALLLIQNWATVTVCDLHTKPLGDMTRQADILCSATGVAHLITADMIKPGATILDFGFSLLGCDWVGDVDFEAAQGIAGAITPVPGGTGSMTNAMLMRNVLTAATRQARFGLEFAIRADPIQARTQQRAPIPQPALLSR